MVVIEALVREVIRLPLFFQSVIASDVVSARTSALRPSTTTEHQVSIVEVDLNLRTADVTSVSAYVTWRFFGADEKPFIDGVQLRFGSLILYI